MTLVDEINAETRAKVQDFFYAESRKIMRARGAMVTSEDAYEMAKREHAPRLLRELCDKCFAEGKFELYYILERFLSAKDRAAAKEVALKEIRAKEKEIDDKINWAASLEIP